MKKRFNLNKIQLKKGFTLLETLIAITILLLSIVGPMTIASKGYLAAVYARDEITAFYLAQEAVEFVRYVRDTNALDHCQKIDNPNYLTDCTDDRWLEGLDSCFDSDGCQISATLPHNAGTNPVTCDAAGCDPLSFNTDTGVYSYDSVVAPVVESKFRRTVKLSSPPSNDNEVKINVVVEWTSSLIGSTKDFIINETLFNWQTPN